MESIPIETSPLTSTTEKSVKTCHGCSAALPLTSFYRNKKRKDGVQTRCKSCMSIHAASWYTRNKSRHRSVGQQYYLNNIESLTQYARDWRQANLEQTKNIQREWKKNNKEKVCSYSAKRRALERKACPAWLTDLHWQQIEAVYHEARRLTELTGILHEVDHIDPLVSDLVCGLHVPWNLRAIPAFQNRSKGNKLECA